MSNTQPRGSPASPASSSVTYGSCGCRNEAKLSPPPSLAGKLRVSGCWDLAAFPRARPGPPEVPDRRGEGAGSSSAAFQSSLGTPPVCGRAVVRGGRREHAGLGHCSAQGAGPRRAAGCKLCAALRELRDSRALQLHRAAGLLQARAPQRRRGGRCCHFLSPAPRREEEGRGARLTPHRRPPPHRATPSCAAGRRCDYPSEGGAIIVDAPRKERLEKTPNSMLFG